MLIADEIQRRCDEGRLFPVEVLDWKGGTVRQVHVGQDLNRFLLTRSEDRTTNKDRRRLQVFFESFILGEIPSAAAEPDVMGTDMKRLSPSGHEVWEIKIGEKHRQWRTFGRFAEHNHFIALTGPTDRAGIDDHAQIVRCQEEWRKILNDLPPLYGSKLDDYISPSGIFVRNS